MKKIIFMLSVLLIISSGYAKEYNTGLTTVRSPQLGKVLADNPERTLVNIGNWGYFVRDNGESAHTPSGSSGGFYPRGTEAIIYQDGVLVGGYQEGNLKVSGQIYRTGTERGYIDANGNHVTQSQDPRVRLYRIRRDWETLTADQVRQDAAEQAEIELSAVSDAQIESIIDQYKTDWQEWPTELGAPFYDLNNNGIYEPGQGETPGIADADQVVWMVITDADTVTTRDLYGTDPIGIEQQMTLWAYNQPGGGLGQIIFKLIRLINKGQGDLEEAYISLWSDPDVGNYTDDLVGVDVEKSLMYVYNGGPVDDNYAKLGLPPPSAGYDFFAGPIVKADGETAIFNLKEREGFRNLPASSFGYFVAGGDYSDPSPYGSVEAAREYYNLMRGFAPLDDLENPTPWIDATTGLPTLFPFNGDPVAGTGFNDSNPADRRMLINSGPFVLAEGDTQDIVVALVGGLGSDNLTSITAMKNTDEIAQKLFDDLFTSVPSAPAAPQPISAVTEETVSLEWGGNMDAVLATENNPRVGYSFQGYNVYQLPTPTASKDQAVRIATYDLIDGVQTVYGKRFLAEYGEVVTVPVQFGLDKGVQRSIEIDYDWINGGPLYAGSDYYFAVTAYNYNPAPALIEDQSLESPLTPVTVTLAPAPVGTAFGAEYGDAISADHPAGASDGGVTVEVVDPMALTGDDYQVTFGMDHYYLDVDGVWKATAEPGVVAKLLDVSPSTVTGSAVTGTGGTLDLNFEVHVVSPDFNYASGVLISIPGAEINSVMAPSGIVSSIQADGQSVLFGDLDMDGAGDFAGGEVVTINVSSSSVSAPIAFDYTVYDDGWASLYCTEDLDGDGIPDNQATCDAFSIGPGYTVNANAEGSGTIDEIGYQFKSFFVWKVRNITTGEVSPGYTIQSGYQEENVVDGKLIPAADVGEGANPIIDGLRINVTGAPEDMKWVGVVSNAAGPLDPVVDGLAAWRYPDWLIVGDQSDARARMQTNGSVFFFNTHPGYGPGGPETFFNSLVVFSGGGVGISALIPDDFEFRFTGNGRFFDNWGDGWFSQPAPFEVWNIGSGTPDDPSDDYQLIIWLLDDNGDGVWGLIADDHETSGAANDPYTDRVYVHAPTDDTPGTVGHDNWWAAMEAGGTQAGWTAGPGSHDPGGPLDSWNVMSRTVFMNWNGGDVADPTFPANVDALEPEAGTVYRFVTTKPNTVNDKFTWTAPANTVSDALAKEAVKMVNVFPNPYYANNSQETNRFDNFMTFTHLPQKATIKIFSLDGKIVRTLEKDSDSQYLDWDIRNYTNLPVASGVYIAHIDMDVDGQNLGSKILKLFVVQANQILEYY